MRATRAWCARGHEPLPVGAALHARRAEGRRPIGLPRPSSFSAEVYLPAWLARDERAPATFTDGTSRGDANAGAHRHCARRGAIPSSTPFFSTRRRPAGRRVSVAEPFARHSSHVRRAAHERVPEAHDPPRRDVRARASRPCRHRVDSRAADELPTRRVSMSRSVVRLGRIERQALLITFARGDTIRLHTHIR